VTKKLIVNVVVPLLLSQLLVPALKAASPVGNEQIPSGGTPFQAHILDDLEGAKVPECIPSYSHSQHVKRVVSLALEKELAAHGIAANVVGWHSPGATSMTASVNIGDLPWFVRCCSPCWTCMVAPDDGKSACLPPPLLLAPSSPANMVK